MDQSEITTRTRSRVGLTDTRVKGLKASGNLYRVWDSHVPGFHVQVTPSGTRAFCVSFQRSSGKKVSATIGTFGAWHVDDARERARELRKLHEQGRDIRAHLKHERTATDMNALIQTWRTDYKPRLKASTQDSYESILKVHIVPALGSRLVRDLAYEDLKALYNRVRQEAPVKANRMLAVLSRLFNIAEREGLRTDGSNPCRKVERTREKPRDVIYSAANLAALESALTALVAQGELEAPIADLIRFIALSGLRRGEATNLTWSDVDLEAKVMTFVNHKTDHDGTKRLPLNTHLAAILQRHSEQKISRYVFPGRLVDGPFNGFGKIWARIRRASGLHGFNPHDLRHTFLTTLVELGHPVALGDTLLGHSLGRIRDTYLNLRPEGSLAVASQETADWIAAAMAGQAPKVGIKAPRHQALPVIPLRIWDSADCMAI
ncbi:MAG TPA: tyrosine-type recombinase/integrase [Geothrix sp.]|jgi:integrase